MTKPFAPFALLSAALAIGGAGGSVAASAAATPAPCATPNAAARVVTLVQPIYSTYMRENHKEGTVDVRVYLTATGTVTKAEIAKSSGDAYLDGATYDAAIATTYLAEVKDCVSVAGSYIYRTRYRGSNDATPAPGTAVVPSATATPPATPSPTATPRTRPTTLPTTYATTVPTTLPTTYATTVPIVSGH